MRRFSLDVGASAASQAVHALAQLTTQIVAVRLLPLNEYGFYAAGVALISLLELSVLNRGGDVAMKHVGRAWIAQDYPRARALGRHLTLSDCVWNFSAYGLLALAAWPLQQLLDVPFLYLLLLGLSLPAQSGYGVSKSVFVVAGHVQRQAVFEIVCALVACSLAVAGLLTFGVFGLLVSVPVSAAVKGVLARAWVARMWPPGSSGWREVRDLDKTRIDADSRKSVARSVLAGAAENADVLILNAFAGPTATATYKVAKSLATLPGRVFGPAWVAIRPRIIREWHQADTAAARRTILRLALPMLAALVLAFPFALWLGDDLLRILFGNKMPDAFVPFLILLVGAWIYHAATSWYRILAALDNERVRGVGAGLVLFAGVTALGLVFGRHSATAMAATTLAALLIATVYCWRYGLWPRRG